MKRYISDYHIGHANVMNFDSRPFSSLDEMHETIIKNWNSVVSNGDEVLSILRRSIDVTERRIMRRRGDFLRRNTERNK